MTEREDWQTADHWRIALELLCHHENMCASKAPTEDYDRILAETYQKSSKLRPSEWQLTVVLQSHGHKGQEKRAMTTTKITCSSGPNHLAVRTPWERQHAVSTASAGAGFWPSYDWTVGKCSCRQNSLCEMTRNAMEPRTPSHCTPSFSICFKSLSEKQKVSNHDFRNQNKNDKCKWKSAFKLEYRITVQNNRTPIFAKTS